MEVLEKGAKTLNCYDQNLNLELPLAFYASAPEHILECLDLFFHFPPQPIMQMGWRDESNTSGVQSNRTKEPLNTILWWKI